MAVDIRALGPNICPNSPVGRLVQSFFCNVQQLMISINNMLIYDCIIDRISTNFNIKDGIIIRNINFITYI